MPRMAVSGVRMSWLRRAMKALFMRLVSSACQRRRVRLRVRPPDSQARPSPPSRAYSQAHVAFLLRGVVQIRPGILADADAAEHFPHPAVRVAAQAALLRHQHGEQTQAALPVLIRRAENFLAALRAFDEASPSQVSD